MRLGQVGVAAAVVAATIAVATTGARGLGPRPQEGPKSPARDTVFRLAPGAQDPDAGASSAGTRVATNDVSEEKQRGVALGMFAEDVGFSYVPLLREIAAIGATHVALIVPVYQTDGRAADVALHTRFSPTLALIADTIRAAKREHLEVTLFPIIRLARPAPGEWRGTLAPKKPDRWFKAYGELLGDLAAAAAQTGATRLVIGSELATLDGDLEPWRPLLERIRRIFPGHLVYSANWDHYRDARLFELVDEEGVVAYFKLREGPGAPATDVALQAAWDKHKDDLLRWHADRPRPLLFTEVGYRSRAGATTAPWDETDGGVPDMDEQQRAFAAFHHTWTRNAALDGAYIWNWYGWGGTASTSYTPRGKPALDEVRRLLQDL